MVKFPSAAKGLKWMFWGETLSIVCVLVGIIPLMGTPSAVGQFVCGLLILAGACWARKDDDRFWMVLFLEAVNLVLWLLDEIGPSRLIDLADGLIELAVIYLVCTAAAAMLEETGFSGLAAQGIGVWKVFLGCFVGAVIFTVLALVVPILALLAGAVMIVCLVVMLVAQIYYLIFLYKSYHALERTSAI